MSIRTSQTGMVLQGFFCAERFRGNRIGVLPGEFWARAPRPELLPGMTKPRLSCAPAAQLRAQAQVVSTPISETRLRPIGPGKPLEPNIRARMEDFFGADFSAVRVHVGLVAQTMGALAFTLGETLHFAPGLYDPSSREGVELLGHELTHVQQQREGRVINPHGRGVAIVQDPALEAEADVMGRRAARAMVLQQRDYLPDKHISFVIVPDLNLDSYRNHVDMRISHFFKVLLKAVLLFRKYSSSLLPQLFTDHAAAQEGSGFRLSGTMTIRGEGNYDAAHLMNTTLILDDFKSLNLSSADSGRVYDLYRSSAATTTQFQTSNVSSDKIIDNAQTNMKKMVIAELNKGTKLDGDFVKNALTDFVKLLQPDLQKKYNAFGKPNSSNQIKIDSYDTALDVVSKLDIDSIAHEIWYELLIYQKEIA